MWRNILAQSLFQVIILLLLVFQGAKWFDVPHGIGCERFHVKDKKPVIWSVDTFKKIDSSTPFDPNGMITCDTYDVRCGSDGTTCYESTREFLDGNGDVKKAKFSDFSNYESTCLTCEKYSYVHGSIIFNTFIFAQVFNEYNARKIFDEWNMFEGLAGNYIFLAVSIVTVLCQIFLIEIGGDFVKTSHLNLEQWLITIAFGAIALPLGVLMRFIPVVEDPDSFFTAYSAENAVTGEVKGEKGEKYAMVERDSSVDKQQV